MNIFYFSHDFKENAEFHCSKHSIKMILEQCQLLSTAHRVLDGREVIELSATGRKQKRFKLVGELEHTLYKSTHANHPSAIWARSSRENYLWLANMTKALCEEYTYRYGKIHKCQADGLVDVLINNLPKNIPDKPFTEPTPAMDLQYVIKGSSIASYRNYFNKAKRHLFDWKNRDVPYWVEI
jgi:hypothetical protein